MNNMSDNTKNLEEEIKNLEKRAEERIELLKMRDWKTVDELVTSVNKNKSLDKKEE